MLTLEVPITEIPLLIYEKYHNRLVTFQKRAEIILLLAIQPYLQRQQIAQIVNVDRDTVTNSIKLYNSSGFVGLMSIQFKGQKSALNTHQAVLETYFLQNHPLSSKEAIHNIKELTNLSRSSTQVRN